MTKFCDETFNTKWFLETRKKEKRNHTHNTHKIYFQSESRNWRSHGFYLDIVICSLVWLVIWRIYSEKKKVFYKAQGQWWREAGILGSVSAVLYNKFITTASARLPPDLPFSVQDFRQAFRGRKQACERAVILKTIFCVSVQVIVLLSTYTIFLCIIFSPLSSLLTACLQQASKNRPKGMSQTWGSSHHFIADCLSNLGCLKENSGGGQKIRCALGSISGGTGKWKEIFE